MVLKANGIEFEIKIKNRKIAYLTKALEGKNLTDLYFKAVANCDVEALATMLFTFGELDNTKIKTIDDMYDFMDIYMEENNKTIKDMYVELANEVNDMGFFNVKMTKEEILEKSNDLMSSINMSEIIEDTTKKMAMEMAQKSFEGYQA